MTYTFLADDADTLDDLTSHADDDRQTDSYLDQMREMEEAAS